MVSYAAESLGLNSEENLWHDVNNHINRANISNLDEYGTQFQLKYNVATKFLSQIVNLNEFLIF